jgi:hypothetical protein
VTLILIPLILAPSAAFLLLAVALSRLGSHSDRLMEEGYRILTLTALARRRSDRRRHGDRRVAAQAVADNRRSHTRRLATRRVDRTVLDTPRRPAGSQIPVSEEPAGGLIEPGLLGVNPLITD